LAGSRYVGSFKIPLVLRDALSCIASRFSTSESDLVRQALVKLVFLVNADMDYPSRDVMAMIAAIDAIVRAKLPGRSAIKTLKVSDLLYDEIDYAIRETCGSDTNIVTKSTMFRVAALMAVCDALRLDPEAVTCIPYGHYNTFMMLCELVRELRRRGRR